MVCHGNTSKPASAAVQRRRNVRGESCPRSTEKRRFSRRLGGAKRRTIILVWFAMNWRVHERPEP